jgi:hypothetical protein
MPLTKPVNVLKVYAPAGVTLIVADPVALPQVVAVVLLTVAANPLVLGTVNTVLVCAALQPSLAKNTVTV